MPEQSEVRKNRRKILQGQVVSDKMQKTCVVSVKWATKHDRYKKVVTRSVKFKVHDEKDTAKIGDTVQIMECRPISKDKRWMLRKVLKESTL